MKPQVADFFDAEMHAAGSRLADWGAPGLVIQGWATRGDEAGCNGEGGGCALCA